MVAVHRFGFPGFTASYFGLLWFDTDMFSVPSSILGGESAAADDLRIRIAGNIIGYLDALSFLSTLLH